jgi:dTDP-glucose 4,6-dehydratase
MNRRLLVTGAAGFIGANFAHLWAKSKPNDRIVILDALTYAGNYANVASLCDQGAVRFDKGDIRDFELVCNLLRAERLDTIVHFAAESHVDRSILGPGEFVGTNIVGTQVLLDAVRAVWLSEGIPHRFHHISTDEVYGSLSPNDAPFAETHPYDPRSPYAASKAASDHLVRAYGHTYGIQYSISNCSNNYGPYQFPEKLIPLCIVNILEGRPLPIYGDGKNVRDWLHVEDHCSAVMRVIEGSAHGSTWNVGGNAELTNIDLVRKLCTAMDEAFARDPSLAARFPNCPAAKKAESAELMTFVKDRPGHDRRYAIDSRRMRDELGWTAQIGLSQGLADTIAWYLNNETWWRNVISGKYKEWVTRQYGRETTP